MVVSSPSRFCVCPDMLQGFRSRQPCGTSAHTQVFPCALAKMGSFCQFHATHLCACAGITLRMFGCTNGICQNPTARQRPLAYLYMCHNGGIGGGRREPQKTGTEALLSNVDELKGLVTPDLNW